MLVALFSGYKYLPDSDVLLRGLVIFLNVITKNDEAYIIYCFLTVMQMYMAVATELDALKIILKQKFEDLKTVSLRLTVFMTYLMFSCL